jgi:hypothetical protein
LIGSIPAGSQNLVLSGLVILASPFLLILPHLRLFASTGYECETFPSFKTIRLALLFGLISPGIIIAIVMFACLAGALSRLF